MNFEEYFEEMKKIQEKLHDYLEDQEETASLSNIFEDNRFHADKKELISLLHFVLNIYNHHQHNNFFSKIIAILQFFKEDIKKISNLELFHIFKSCKKILLFLHQEHLFAFNEQIVKEILQDKFVRAHYPEYFSPEIRPFIDKEWFPEELKENDWLTKELPEDFYEKRKNGQNDGYICDLIRKDSIDDFITYINQNQYSLNSIINPSIFETNNFLLKQDEVSLIEYAVFFGSIQIYNYLRLNNVEFPCSLWIYAIHGKNAEIIHSLEENGIKPEDKSYRKYLIESIKCHHNDIADYIQNRYLLQKKEISNDIMVNSLKYYNLYFEQNDLINEKSFCYLVKYDYYILVKFILKEKDIDINAMKILIWN